MKNRIKYLFVGAVAFVFLLALCTVAFAGADVLYALVKTLTLGGVFSTAVVTFTSIGEATSAQKSGKIVRDRIWFVHKSQVDISNFAPGTGRTVASIPLLSGQYWAYVDVISDSVKPKSTGTANDVGSTIANELAAMVGGSSDEALTLLENGIGQGFFIIYEFCDGTKWLGGSSCKPLKMEQFEWVSDNDKTAATITFKNTCGEMWKRFTGTIPTQAAVSVAANATTFALQSNSRYQLASGTAAAAAISGISGVTDADINRTITLLGSGGAFPSTISATATAFLLIAGNTWTANEGSQITFQIKKFAAGSYTFEEVSGSRS